MKILIYSNQGLSPTHLGMEMELIESLLLKGHSITLLKCDNKTSACFFNPTGNIIACAICESRSTMLHKNITNKNVKILSLPKIENVPQFEVQGDDFYQNLESYEFKNYKIGRGILSSVISLTRDYNIKLDKHGQLLQQQFEIAYKSLLGFIEIYEKEKPDKIYIFNGRFSETFPIISFCERHQIAYASFEVGATPNKYEVFDQSLPHSIMTRRQNMDKLWDNAPDNKTQLSKEWYYSKVSGHNLDDVVYTKNQNKNKLPSNFNKNKKNIVFFNSSEDEMRTIEDWSHNLYGSQNEAIKTIVEYFKDDKDTHFYLRVHPNLGLVENMQMTEIKSFKYDNLTIISPSDPTDSYSILKACEYVITFGSTIGIEATFHGAISIMFGRSFYENLDCVYEPKSYKELYDTLIDNTIQSKPIQNTYAYGYYLSNRGEVFNKFKYNGKYNSSYSGKRIKRIYPLTYFFILKYAKGFIKWRRNFTIIYGKKPTFKDIFKLTPNTK